MVTRVRSAHILVGLGVVAALVALVLLGISMRIERMRTERMVLSRRAIAIVDEAVAGAPAGAIEVRARHSVTKQTRNTRWLQGEFVLDADAAADTALRARVAELGRTLDLHVVADGEYTENGYVVHQWSLRRDRVPLVQVVARMTRIPAAAVPPAGIGGLDTDPRPAAYAAAGTTLAAVRRDSLFYPVLRPCPPRAAIIIDDIGYIWPIAQAFLEFDRPLTLAVFPHLEHSQHIARIAHARGLEIMMHMPMESGSTRVNPGTMRTDMSPADVERQWRAALQSVPGVVGLNNHQGSIMTSDAAAMERLLRHVQAEGMFFIDSRTTVQTVARATAARMGVPTTENDLFLDNVQDVEYIKQKCRDLLALALVRGDAIGIGHAHPVTLQALQEVLPEFDAAGVQLVYASILVN